MSSLSAAFPFPRPWLTLQAPRRQATQPWSRNSAMLLVCSFNPAFSVTSSRLSEVFLLPRVFIIHSISFFTPIIESSILSQAMWPRSQAMWPRSRDPVMFLVCSFNPASQRLFQVARTCEVLLLPPIFILHCSFFFTPAINSSWSSVSKASDVTVKLHLVSFFSFPYPPLDLRRPKSPL